MGESTIDIQCWFIDGSDALVCKVVTVQILVMYMQTFQGVPYRSASEQLSLTHNIEVYESALTASRPHPMRCTESALMALRPHPMKCMESALIPSKMMYMKT